MTEQTEAAPAEWQDPEYRPPLNQAVPLGLQHVLAMFAGNVTVPIIISFAVGTTPDERVFLIQMAMFVAGVATLLQTVGVGPIGARLPVVQGTSFGFLPIMIPLAKNFGLAAVFGGAIVAGVTQFILGWALPQIRRFMPPVVSGVVVITIGLTLLRPGIDYAAGGNPGVVKEAYGALSSLGMATFVIIVTLLLHRYGSAYIRATAIFSGMAIGYLVSIPLGLVDLGRIAGAAWFEIPQPLAYGLSFPIAAVIGMIIMAFVTTVETVGDISGITIGGANRQPTDKELRGGILADGAGTVIGALFTALPNTSYSQNVGLVSFTRVMSRYVVTIGAIFLVGAGLIPKIGAVISAMPQPVLGGGALIMFGMIISAGMKLVGQDGLTHRNMLIVATSLAVGFGFWIRPDAAGHFPSEIKVLLNTGIIPATVVAVLMHLFLKPQEK